MHPRGQVHEAPKKDGKPVHFCNSSSTPVLTERGLDIYTTATDKTGAIWERWSSWQAGHWEEIQRPTR